MAAGYTSYVSGNLMGAQLRFYYATSYNAATNQSVVYLTPQILTTTATGGLLGYNGAVYGNGSPIYSMGTGYAGDYILQAPNGINTYLDFLPKTGSIGSFTIQHDNAGAASFSCGYYGYYRAAVDGTTGRIYSSDGISQSISEPRSLYVGYDSTGGSYVGPTYFYGSTEYIYLSSTVPTRTGYTFAGWYTAASGGTYLGGAGAPIGYRSGSFTAYAHWTVNSYTVTCQDYCDSTPLGSSTASYNYGSTVSGASFGSSAAYDAYYTGYHYTGSSQAVQVTGATTVYRYFALNTWTVSYSANGGSSTPASQTKTYGTALTLAAAIARANTSAGSFTVTYNYNGSGKSDTTDSSARTTSYAFVKWNTAQDGSGTGYSAGGSYTANAAATMYAQWTSFESAASVSLPSAVWTGRTFDGWFTAAVGGTKVGGAGGSYTPSGNVTLYAHWTINTFTYTAAAGTDVASVSLNGTASATSVSATVDYGSTNSFVAVMDDNVAFDYTFDGWYNGANKVSSDLSYTPPTATGALSLTANAVKTAKSYTLSFAKPNTGGSAEVRRTSSPNGGGNIGALQNGAVIYYGDVLVVSYTENPGYEVDVHTIDGVEFTSPATVTVTGPVSVVVSMKNAGVVWIWDGVSWEKYIPMIWNGSSWERYIPVLWDGSAWTIY